MKRIDNFKTALSEKRAIKVIAGINNFNLKNITDTVNAANIGGAHAVDICFDEEIYTTVRSMTELPIFVSSIIPEDLATAAEWGADAIEIGNYDTLYRDGLRITAEEIKNTVIATQELLNGKDIFICVTVPGHIEVAEQIKLTRWLENRGINLVQTEGAATVSHQSSGAMGLLETAKVSIANTMELVHNCELPVMTASGISVQTAPLAFAAGASAIGVGSAVNKCNSEISMIAVVRSLVELTSNNLHNEVLHA